MIYLWTSLIIAFSYLIPANAYYKRVTGIDLRPAQALEAKAASQEYINRISPKITDHWHPSNSQRPLRSVFYFTIQPTGHITHLTMPRGSGDNAYDKACKKALMAASPLKKPDEAKRIGLMFESHKTKDLNPLEGAKDVALSPFKAIF